MDHVRVRCVCLIEFFFFNDTATTEIYTLSLHDALPISNQSPRVSMTPSRVMFSVTISLPMRQAYAGSAAAGCAQRGARDRKSTRLNSSHANISYAVFCLKKNKIHAVTCFIALTNRTFCI